MGEEELKAGLFWFIMIGLPVLVALISLASGAMSVK